VIDPTEPAPNSPLLTALACDWRCKFKSGATGAYRNRCPRSAEPHAFLRTLRDPTHVRNPQRRPPPQVPSVVKVRSIGSTADRSLTQSRLFSEEAALPRTYQCRAERSVATVCRSSRPASADSWGQGRARGLGDPPTTSSAARRLTEPKSRARDPRDLVQNASKSSTFL
jgi:hypothetical protein